MRGFVPTPDATVDQMVSKLFDGKPPREGQSLLDPGCGPGAFIDGVIRWCKKNKKRSPKIIGYESHPERHAEAVKRFRAFPNIEILCQDFLKATGEPFDYIIGNPPYVPITEISKSEKMAFRRRFVAAEGRFDLYLLFFEQALRLLNLNGRLVFITPEKFLYVNSARSFRRVLANYYVREINMLSEETFADLVTYPTITTIDSPTDLRSTLTAIVSRSGQRKSIVFPKDSSSLQPLLHDEIVLNGYGMATLGDICRRISCGIATGFDSVFVRKTGELTPGMKRFAFPTISGRELGEGSTPLISDRSMLIPYNRRGQLLALSDLGELKTYLARPDVKEKLKSRTCVDRKPWHAFHDSVPLADILKPKLICKDIAAKPRFWVDRTGEIVPRHSVYYIVPQDESKIDALAEFLNGPEAAAWLNAHCQRASKGFLRLQSSVLKRLPIPDSLNSAEDKSDPAPMRDARAA